MIGIEEAQKTILKYITPLETEKVDLFRGLNRVTSEDHIAPWDIPAADNSAMDGYAFSHAALTGDRLRVIGFLPAGEADFAPVRPGEAVKIMTGAPIPPGCDTVVPIEDAEEDGGWIRLTSAVKAGMFIRKKGEDIRKGGIVIPAGRQLRPAGNRHAVRHGNDSPDRLPPNAGRHSGHGRRAPGARIETVAGQDYRQQ